MEIKIYLEPIGIKQSDFIFNDQRKRYCNIINTFYQEDAFPDLDGINIALLGVKEDRLSINNFGCAYAPDEVRKKFYRLFPHHIAVKIADIGNIKSGHTVEDTYFAVAEVVASLLKNGILPIIIGGSHDITYSNYKAYERLGQIINMFVVDPMFDLGEADKDTDSQSFLSKIILHQPNYLFNYTNIGYQTYFVDNEAIELMDKLYFDTYRLGVIKKDIEEVEPLVRNADMISVDISAVRQADAPGNANASPNGFNGEDICQIVRYAGLSDKLTSIGFYETNPTYDINGQTSFLVAEMIWYFIDGYCNRKQDFPYLDKENYKKYYVTIQNHSNEIVFYKSKKSDRWWMEVPCPVDLKVKYERHYLVPCSYNDYQIALENEIPERWWQVFKKLM